MAFLRKIRSRVTGRAWYYVVENVNGRQKSHPCGTNKAVAVEALNQFNVRRTRRKLGLPLDPPRCTWTLGYVADRDIADATRNGKDVKTRLKVWKAIHRTIPRETLIEAITADSVLDFSRPQLKNATVRRRRALLRFALAEASRSSRSGYSGNPFGQLAPLMERREARLPVALTRKQFAVLLRLLDRPTARWSRLQVRTASRPGERPENTGSLLIYSSHKRGEQRRFFLTPILRGLLASPHSFSRRSWDRAVKSLGIHVRPHDLRHTALSWAAAKPGASLMGIMKLGGWKSPAMASRYLHGDAQPIETI